MRACAWSGVLQSSLALASRPFTQPVGHDDQPSITKVPTSRNFSRVTTRDTNVQQLFLTKTKKIENVSFFMIHDEISL
jgi:hypothetical protein